MEMSAYTPNSISGEMSKLLRNTELSGKIEMAEFINSSLGNALEVDSDRVS